MYELVTNDGRPFSFSVPDPCDRPSFFLFSLPKSGSTLLMQIMTEVCQKKKIPIVDFATDIFNKGIQPGMLTDDINTIWNERGYAYLGFRSFFPAISFDFSKTKNILLIRDPRDMLVSLYFSLRYSHVEPENAGLNNSISLNRERLKKSDINESVIGMAQSYRKYFSDYLEQLPAETTRVYRYEDVIFKKEEWLLDMLNFLKIEISVDTIKKIANKYDIRPDAEDPKKHIRQIVPGNYKVHLNKTAIHKLDEMFKPIMNYFQYDSVVSLTMDKTSNLQNVQKKIGFSDDSKNSQNIGQMPDYRIHVSCYKWLLSCFRKLRGV